MKQTHEMLFFTDIKRSTEVLVAQVLLRVWRSGQQKENYKAGDQFVHESIIGSQFVGRVEALTKCGDYPMPLFRALKAGQKLRVTTIFLSMMMTLMLLDFRSNNSCI